MGTGLGNITILSHQNKRMGSEGHYRGAKSAEREAAGQQTGTPSLLTLKRFPPRKIGPFESGVLIDFKSRL